MMTKDTAASVALLLVAVAWPLAFFAAVHMMATPSPDIPRAQFESTWRLLIAAFFAGVLSLVASICLAAYAFSAAKVRAGIALAAGGIPLAIIVGTHVVDYEKMY